MNVRRGVVVISLDKVLINKHSWILCVETSRVMKSILISRQDKYTKETPGASF